MRGPYVNAKAVYRLDFGAFQIGTHLRLLGRVESEVRGLNADDMNLEAFFCDPKEGHPDLKHNMEAAISPDFMGLSGRFTFKAKPEARLLPLVKAFGLKVDGVFTQDPGDVDDSSGWEVWELLRRVRVGLEPDTKAPRYETTTENVRLKLTKPPTGDETTDFETLSAQVLALKGTLKQGDVVTQTGGESYAVIASPYPEGDYERAELRLREY